MMNSKIEYDQSKNTEVKYKFDYLKYFPTEMRRKIEEHIFNLKNLEEIRIRVNKPIVLNFGGKEEILEYITTKNEINAILEKICSNSIYSFQDEICEGYITIPGGHRVGLVGTCIFENEKVKNIKEISSLNFRIAKQIKGVAINALKYIVNLNNNSIYNTVIVSPPGAGKTTLIKDIVRQISNGIESVGFKGLTVGVIDERGEISATYRGENQNNIGMRTDVLVNIPKSIGMRIMIRTMSPKVIVADEIGKKEDYEAIEYMVKSGVKGIFSMHGNNIKDIKNNENIRILLDRKYIERIIFLDEREKGKIKEIYFINDETVEHVTEFE